MSNAKNKTALTAAVKKAAAAKTAAPKKAAAPAAVKKALNNIDFTYDILNKSNREKGIHITLMAEKLNVEVKVVRRLIDQVRANRGYYVIRTAPLCFTLGAAK